MIELIWISLFLINACCSRVHEFDWTLTEIIANPDGLADRPVIALNNQWPFPVIQITKNDRILVNLTNNLNESTSLHFHGIFQKNTTYMDGAAMISQCPIQPGDSFLYNFTVDQIGTYWYHSHDAAQYGDGFRGVLIVEESEDERTIDYDDNIVISLSDWYHRPTREYVEGFFTANSRGGEPSIQGSLFNETTEGQKIKVEPSKTYYLRIVNVGMSASQYFYIEDHDLTIVEIDGVLVEPKTVDSLKMTTGQRYGALLKTKTKPDKNYQVVQATNVMMSKLYSTNWLIYDETIEVSQNAHIYKKVNELKFIDDLDLKPLGNISIYDEPTHEMIFDYDYDYYTENNIRYYTLNGKSHLAPKIPTVNTVFAGNATTVLDPVIYGEATNAFLIEKGDIVQIVLNSHDHMRHPFHLHGHNFQVLSRGAKTHYDNTSVTSLDFPQYPMMRDTVEVPGRGYVVLRFKADNPGVWFFHCHTEWHAVQGLGIVFIESPQEILKDQELPTGNLQVCLNGGIDPALGNAAGNEDLYNLTGQVKVPELFNAKKTQVDEHISMISDLPSTITTSPTTTLSTKSSKHRATYATDYVNPHRMKMKHKPKPSSEAEKSEESVVSLAKQTTVILIYGSLMIAIASGVAWVVSKLIAKKNIKNKRVLVQNNYSDVHDESSTNWMSEEGADEEAIPLTVFDSQGKSV